MNDNWWTRYELAQDHQRELLRDAQHQSLLRSLRPARPAALRRAAAWLGHCLAALGQRIEAYGQAPIAGRLEADV